MPSTIIFPDGVRLARKDEIPGPESQRSEAWARVEGATIARGFVMQSVTNEPFTHYAEINVDAPRLWEVFSDLCNVLLDSPATFVVGGLDSELVPVGPVNVHASTQLLAQHQYQLAHDGFLQYSLVSDHDGKVTEIFVTPEKYLKVWMNDETTFRGVMARHEIGEASSLKFLDEFPRTTVALSPGAASVRPTESLIKYLQDEILVVGSNGN